MPRCDRFSHVTSQVRDHLWGWLIPYRHGACSDTAVFNDKIQRLPITVHAHQVYKTSSGNAQEEFVTKAGMWIHGLVFCVPLRCRISYTNSEQARKAREICHRFSLIPFINCFFFFFNFLDLLILLFVRVWLFFYFAFVYVCVSYRCLVPWGLRSPTTGVTDGCDLPCGWWELNPGPFQEQQALLVA